MLKKVMICLVLCTSILLICGCNKNSVVPKKEEKKTPIPIPSAKVDPLPLGLYYKEGGSRHLVTTMESTWVLNQDLLVLTAFGSKEEILDGAILDVFPKYWTDAYQSYQIGYMLEYTIGSGEVVKKTILSPEDTKEIYSYLQVYLYDDVHQQRGQFYSHVEKMEEGVLLTSIKLTGSTFTHDIISPIKITVFLYQDKKEFDQKGLYTGVNQYSIILNKKA